jgi:hypothetical protein
MWIELLLLLPLTLLSLTTKHMIHQTRLYTSHKRLKRCDQEFLLQNTFSKPLCLSIHPSLDFVTDINVRHIN